MDQTQTPETTQVAFRKFEEYEDLSAGRAILDRIRVDEMTCNVSDLQFMAMAVDGKPKVFARVGDDKKMLPLSKTAIKSLKTKFNANFTGLGAFIDSSELVKEVIKHILNRTEKPATISFTDDQILDVYEPTKPRLTPKETYEICEANKDIKKIETLAVNPDGSFEFYFLTEEMSAPPTKVNEPSHSGLYVSSNGKVEVSPYVMTLSCTNGLRSPKFGGSLVTEKDDLQGKVVSLIEQGVEQSHQLLDRLINLEGTQINDLRAYAANYFRNNLPIPTASKMMRNVDLLPADGTAYDLVQFVTQHSSRQEDRKFQDIGYRVLDSFKLNRCGSCSSVITPKD